MAIAHDYLTQCGGAERVVLHMVDAFPGAPVYTSLFDAFGTFPRFSELDIRTQSVDRIGVLRRHHRAAFPLLALSFSNVHIDADVTVCSSSGWAHGVHTSGRKIVYCHTPARWLYQGHRYLGVQPRLATRAALALLSPSLRRWDKGEAASADRYIVTSTAVRQRVKDLYGRDAEVLPPPPALGPGHPQSPVKRIDPGYWLCVSRLMPYKHVDAVVEAFSSLPNERLIVVGAGPQEAAIRSMRNQNVSIAGRTNDDELAWLYDNCKGVVLASHEDYGLVPLEAAAFGRPAVVLAWGGFLDTVVAEKTGLFFDTPEPDSIACAVSRASMLNWSRSEISLHAQKFGSERFIAKLREIISEERALN